MPIQDNLNGALLISAIDFILSFVIIGGIGLILALFPLLNRFRKRDEKCPVTVPPEQSALKKSGSSSAASTTSPSNQSAATDGIHPGLSDQQLVVVLTAAAYEALGHPVRIDKIRLLSAKGWIWSAQGRQELQSHRLK
jgi:hypothetical protein